MLFGTLFAHTLTWKSDLHALLKNVELDRTRGLGCYLGKPHHGQNALRKQSLAKLFSVSRMMAHDALRRLEARGIVQISHRAGPVNQENQPPTRVSRIPKSRFSQEMT
ncbi:GntR family transcriptional regulator [Methylobacterium sp. E-065]|uniref:GntR family transcriptional regulator n=1 Tax=Methylobacterium sp. E-065 TaxID=2836583 RepID=UPI00391C77AC